MMTLDHKIVPQEAIRQHDYERQACGQTLAPTSLPLDVIFNKFYKFSVDYFLTN